MQQREKQSGNPVYILPLIIIAGAALRLVLIGRLPYGLNQDEASIGYDAWSLLSFGIDRNGYPWPIYPITWGSGGGSPLMIYLTVLSTKILGRSIFSLRIIPAILGALTPLVAALVLLPDNTISRDTPAGRDWERSAGRGSAAPGKASERAFVTACFAAFIIAINPWHIMLSRWALDSNTLPFFQILAILALVRAANATRHRLPRYMLCAALFALLPYSYGSATIVVPMVMVLSAVWLMLRKRMTLAELICSALTFTIVLLPLIAFFAINKLGMDAVITPYFSIPTFTSERSIFLPLGSDDLFTLIKNNVWYLIKFFTLGAEDGEIICNYVPGFAQMYKFTFPLTLIGIALGIFRTLKGKSTTDAVMLFFTLSTALFTLFIEPDINRMTLLLIPMCYFQAVTLSTLYMMRRELGIAAGAALLAACGFFAVSYFGPRYAGLSHDAFMPGYTEAVRCAVDIAGDERVIISTYTGLSAPFMSALYESETPPGVFLETVEWKDENAEFRVAKEFGRFIFGLPEDGGIPDTSQYVVILHTSETGSVDESSIVATFGDYAVAARE
ncbi:MAG: hypothetical protein K6C95_11060 [Lachnospiraceae bacterium]|nr:hypothetical protein [Lachnospiraceae bacterium]